MPRTMEPWLSLPRAILCTDGGLPLWASQAGFELNPGPRDPLCQRRVTQPPPERISRGRC